MGFNIGFQEFFYVSSGGAWPNSGTTEYFTPPDGVHWVWVKAIAGGGGGGSSVKYFATDPGAGGGGAGESVEGVQIPVTPGVDVPIYVGGGGAGGVYGVTSYNVHAGPEGNTAAGSAGFGGEDTTVGPIRLKGGYGASQSSSGHGGMGGGSQAGPKGVNSGTGNTNNGDRIGGAAAPGQHVLRKDCGRFWAGSGGGASTNNNTGTGTGGDQGPFLGGAEGDRTGGSGNAWSGAGGGASVFGPGGAGGAVDANAPAVPTGSYGAGGGGGGGNTTTYGGPSIQAWSGARGGHGYVSLHYFITTPSKYVLSTQTGSFTLTGNAVTFTYP